MVILKLQKTIRLKWGDPETLMAASVFIFVWVVAFRYIVS